MHNNNSQCDIYSGARFVPEKTWHKTTTYINAPAVGVKVRMSIKSTIHNMFGGKAFDRPLFYSLPGGLRFELSEGGDWLEQFDLAFRKAIEICSSIFDKEIAVCIRIFGGKSVISILPTIRELNYIGLYPKAKKEYWKEKNMEDPEWATDEEYWHTIAYCLPVRDLKKLLWCSLACDQGIKPCPSACYYLFDLDKKIAVFPYDDRGMDVVGPNQNFLSDLYAKYSSYLLEYDIGIMNATFGKKP